MPEPGILLKNHLKIYMRANCHPSLDVVLGKAVKQLPSCHKIIKKNYSIGFVFLRTGTVLNKFQNFINYQYFKNLIALD